MRTTLWCDVKKRLLFLTSRNPYAGFGGDRLRAKHLVAQLAKEFEVTVWCFENRDVDSIVAEFEKLVRLECFKKGKVEEFFRILAACVPGGKPLQVAMNINHRMQRAARVRASEFDVVFVHLIRMAEYAKFFDCPCVLDYCDAVSVNADQTSKYAGRFSFWGLVNGFEAPRVEKYERGSIETMRIGIAASVADLEILGIDRDKSLLIPQGRPGVPVPLPPSTICRALFIGKMDYFPNFDAVCWFCENVLARVDFVTLRVVGPISASRRQRLLKYPRVECTGAVEDLYAACEGCTLGIAPMRVATGIQNKILDYLAFGLPVVASSAALRGLPFGTQTVGVIAADSENEWVDSLVCLQSDDRFGKSVRELGPAYIREFHDWNAIGDSLNRRMLASL